MTARTATELRVGDKTVDLAKAEVWVSKYTDAEANRRAKAAYAFPAYDKYMADADPDHLVDADLLAPALLNVGLSIRSFYGLQNITDQLEEHLRAIPVDLCLQNAGPDTIRELVGPLYVLLDSPRDRPWGVRETTLSKVLHRKRPHFLVLHDKQVQNCYRGMLHIPTKGRSSADYMIELSSAVARDLRDQSSAWDRLELAVGEEGPISRVRLIDIIAWRVGGRSADGLVRSPSLQATGNGIATDPLDEVEVAADDQ
ncbi:hypothetical protein SAMN03159343_3436 [Klenkia marina]|uniref:Uncharacterized protein n=1 Tax=Klenkia marina TaxID=1960309 RepID=A0A1G4YSV7_9ACTN|nr:DUF6308 family protein [Klenkia marina]SCX56514.1 hypothetical protein SAMN03159343_3436 [Klenkia marina]